MSAQLFNAWLVLLKSLIKRVDVVIVICGALVLGCALFLVFQVVNFSELQLKSRLKAIYPDFYILDSEEPQLEGVSFEQHLLSRNQNLIIELTNNSYKGKLLLADLRIRTATANSPAAGVYPAQLQAYVTRPIFNRLQQLLDKDQPILGLRNSEGELTFLEVSLLPIETNERWIVLHPETASNLEQLGHARMQTWIPLLEKNTNPEHLKKLLQEQGSYLETWEDLLPLNNRLTFSLLVTLAPWLTGFIIVLGFVFVALISQAFINQIYQWLKIAAFFISQPFQIRFIIFTTSLVLTSILVSLMLILHRFVSYYLAQLLPLEVQANWLSLQPSAYWVLLGIPAALLVLLVVKLTWLPNNQAYWEGSIH